MVCCLRVLCVCGRALVCQADGAVDESSTSSLLRFLAVGRLVALPDGRWADGKHQLLAFYSAKDDREVKAYKSHCKAIMNKGANKLQPGKRIRLTSDNNDYDLHVLADHAEDDPALTVIFFAVTDPSFGKHHTVSSLLRELKKDFYAATDVRELTATTSTGSLNRQLQQPLARIFSAYNQSKLREVQAKVEKVKSVMKDNVDKSRRNHTQPHTAQLPSTAPPRICCVRSSN